MSSSRGAIVRAGQLPDHADASALCNVRAIVCAGDTRIKSKGGTRRVVICCEQRRPREWSSHSYGSAVPFNPLARPLSRTLHRARATRGYAHAYDTSAHVYTYRVVCKRQPTRDRHCRSSREKTLAIGLAAVDAATLLLFIFRLFCADCRVDQSRARPGTRYTHNTYVYVRSRAALIQLIRDNGLVYTERLAHHLYLIFETNTITHGDVNNCELVWVR